MKSAISVFFVLVLVALCFFGCSNVPDEPATTALADYSYVNPFGETVAPPENTKENSSETYAVKYIETVNNVEFVLSSYYVYGNSVGTITNIKIEDDGISNNASGYADVLIMGIGSRKEGLKIGYTAYDKDGKVVKDVYLLAKLDGVKKGDTVEERRFEVPRDAVKIVFHDYVEKN